MLIRSRLCIGSGLDLVAVLVTHFVVLEVVLLLLGKLLAVRIGKGHLDSRVILCYIVPKVGILRRTSDFKRVHFCVSAPVK